MKKLILAATIASLSIPQALANVDISVVGVVSSIACKPTASANGMVNYGLIKPSALSDDKPTVLEARTLELNVNCEGTTNLALRADAHRKHTTAYRTSNESAVGAGYVTQQVKDAGLGKNLPEGLPVVINPMVAGLGLNSKGQKIGGYMLNLPRTLIQLDGKTPLRKYWTFTLPSQTSAWRHEQGGVTGQGDSLLSNESAYFSWGVTVGDTVKAPDKFKDLHGKLVVQAFIAAKKDLDTSTPVYLDGAATIELFYY